MPLFVPENKGCLPMLRNGKTADELEVIAPRQYALVTILYGVWMKVDFQFASEIDFKSVYTLH
jgi:hypothetical protein